MDYKKSPASFAISILLVVVVLVMLALTLSRKPAVTVPTPTTADPSTGLPVLAISGNIDDLVSVSISPGEKLSGVQTITGSLKGAYFFEATARGSVLDANKNSLKNFPLSATGDWMTTDAVPFSASVDLSGIAPGKGYIRLGNDNPSGDPSRDKYVDIPVVFQ